MRWRANCSGAARISRMWPTGGRRSPSCFTPTRRRWLATTWKIASWCGRSSISATSSPSPSSAPPSPASSWTGSGARWRRLPISTCRDCIAAATWLPICPPTGDSRALAAMSWTPNRASIVTCWCSISRASIPASSALSASIPWDWWRGCSIPTTPFRVFAAPCSPASGTSCRILLPPCGRRGIGPRRPATRRSPRPSRSSWTPSTGYWVRGAVASTIRALPLPSPCAVTASCSRLGSG